MSGATIRRKYVRKFKGLSRHSRVTAGLILTSYLLQIVVAGGFAAFLLNQPSGIADSVAIAVLLIFIATRFRGLNNIVHECSHYSFTENHKDNVIFGSIAAAVLLSSFSAYRAEHMTHHAHLGDYEKDLDIRTLKQFRLESALTWTTVLRHVLTPILGRHLPTYIAIDLSRRDGAALLALKAAIMLGAFGLLLIAPLTATVVLAIPFLWIYTGLNYWADCIDHAGILTQEDPLESSRNAIVPKSVRWLLFPRNDCFHLIHHLFPNIPAQHFEDCHEMLLQDPDYRRVAGGASATGAHAPSPLIEGWR